MQFHTNLIKDPMIRAEIEKINRRLDRIENIPQLTTATTLEQLIAAVNKITNSIKRRGNDT